MCSTGDRLEFAAPSTDFEMEQEDFMPIRIRCHDKKQQGTQVADFGEINAELLAVSTSSYTDRKPMFRMLCGSI